MNQEDEKSVIMGVMQKINRFLDMVRSWVRAVMRVLAHGLDHVMGGRLHPNHITFVGLFAHLPIAWLIATQKYVPAALLLIVFGLFDSLDGALARVQKRESEAGMLLDSVTDRMKEVFLYSGAALAMVGSGHPKAAVWAVVACGGSLLVSYVNAWGEAVAARAHLDQHGVNQSFRSGLMTFDVRMAVLIIGLASDKLIPTVAVIGILSWLTAIGRLRTISKALS